MTDDCGGYPDSVKTARIIESKGVPFRLRFIGFQPDLFGPEQAAWLVLAPRREFHGRVIHTRKGARATEVIRTAEREITALAA